jgi:hypothetical protein
MTKHLVPGYFEMYLSPGLLWLFKSEYYMPPGTTGGAVG